NVLFSMIRVLRKTGRRRATGRNPTPEAVPPPHSAAKIPPVFAARPIAGATRGPEIWARRVTGWKRLALGDCPGEGRFARGGSAWHATVLTTFLAPRLAALSLV